MADGKKDENIVALLDLLANKAFAQKKQEKVEYVINALIELYKAYGDDDILAFSKDDDDKQAREIVHQSLVNQAMKDYGDSFPVQYIEKYMRKLF